MRTRGVLAGVLVMLGLGLPVASAPPAVPQTRSVFTVTTTSDFVNPVDDFLSLREAVVAATANAGADDTIELAPGAVYTIESCDGPDQEDTGLYGDLDHIDPTGQLTILGNGATIQQGCIWDDERVLHSVGPKLVLHDLTITKGDVGTTMAMSGGGVLVDGDLELDGVTITGNRAGSVPDVDALRYPVIGAGVSVSGDLEATASTISGNSASGADSASAEAGGVYVGGNALVDHTDILGNTATTSAGGMWVIGDLTATSSTIDGNDAGADSALLVGGDLTLVDTDILENTANSGIVQATSITATATDVSHNAAAAGVALDAEAISFTDSLLSNNTAQIVVAVTAPGEFVGNALVLDGVNIMASTTTGATIDVEGSAEIVDSVISANSATGAGSAGAGVLVSGAMSMQGSTVSDNNSTTSDPGGFAGVRTGGPTTIETSTFQDNVAPSADHAGVWAADALTVSKSTFAHNEAANDGDSYAGVVSDGDVDVLASTIVDNAAGRAGVVGDDVQLFQSTVVFNRVVHASVTANVLESTASIIANEELSLNVACEVPPGASTSGGFNMVRSIGCGLAGPSDQAVTEVFLASLDDNGGPTETMLPLSLPVRIPKARFLCAGEDQRGVVRPVGFACEPGAVEADLGPPPMTFSDVPLSHPFFAEVDCLVMMGATEGFADGTFRPTDNITRQAVVAWLWRLAGSPDPAGAPTFSDVPASHPFAKAIAWGSETGLVQGFPDGTFRPFSSVTRQAVAAWLWRQAGEQPVSPGAPFPDVPESHPFVEAIKWLVDNHITTGFSDGTFRPGNNVTRMALAAWVCRDPLL